MGTSGIILGEARTFSPSTASVSHWMVQRTDNARTLSLGSTNVTIGPRSDFCLNRVEVDTASPRFAKISNTRFRSLVFLT